MLADQSFDDRMTALLVSECVSMFDDLRRSGLKSVYSGPPPDRLDIRIGRCKGGEIPAFKKLPKRGARVFVYNGRGLYAAEPSLTRSGVKRGVYYEEAYAEAAYNTGGRACITVEYGPRYLSGYLYDIVIDGDDCWLENMRERWVS